MTEEVWLPVRGYETRYEVSDLGRVRSIQYLGKPRLLMLKPMANSGGYLTVALHKGGVQSSAMVHTLVADAFIGPRPLGMTINHLSGVKAQNAASNLEYCTHSENNKHAVRMGLRSNAGVKSRHTLDDAKVIEVRRLVASGMKQKEIAMMMNVDPSCISRANSGARWSHVSAPVAAGA